MKHSGKPPAVGLDSHCLSYLLDAIAGIAEPTDGLGEERKALIRIWFYTPETYYLTETVVLETAAIQAVERRDFHESFIRTNFLDIPVRNRDLVVRRAETLFLSHPECNDCLVVAEAEELELDALLTYDQDLLKRLAHRASGVLVTKPSSAWLK